MSISLRPWWAWTWPALALAIMIMTVIFGAAGATAAVAGVVLIAAVFAAVYHAEVVAHRTGEPFGTLVLALAVTIIEVTLIVSVMLGVAADKAGLARDTVFAVVMIVCNGIVGLCLLWGGMRHHEQGFQVQGASAALAVLASLTILTMILPNYTLGTPGPAFSTSQLIFASVVSLVLYGSFVFIQTLRHRDYFLPLGGEEEQASPPSNKVALISFGLLLVSLACQDAYARRGNHDPVARRS
jgi:Ca2+:H+ antiporter